MSQERLRNPHPGDMLREEYLPAAGISAYRLAKATGLTPTRISQILRRKRGITAETALRLGRFFGTSAEFWLGLQRDYDLEEARDALARELETIRPLDWSITPAGVEAAREGYVYPDASEMGRTRLPVAPQPAGAAGR